MRQGAEGMEPEADPCRLVADYRSGALTPADRYAAKAEPGRNRRQQAGSLGLCCLNAT